MCSSADAQTSMPALPLFAAIRNVRPNTRDRPLAVAHGRQLLGELKIIAHPGVGTTTPRPRRERASRCRITLAAERMGYGFSTARSFRATQRYQALPSATKRIYVQQPGARRLPMARLSVASMALSVLQAIARLSVALPGVPEVGPRPWRRRRIHLMPSNHTTLSNPSAQAAVSS